MNLKRFLNRPENGTTVEAVFTYRLLHDLMTAAARLGYHLGVQRPDVDRDGYDLVLDDGTCTRKVQVKSTAPGSTTTSWDLRKRFLRPKVHNVEAFGFEPSPEGEGVEGCVIVTHATMEDDTVKDVRYWFTDVYVLVALAQGLVPRNRRDIGVAQRKLAELRHGGGSTTLELTKSTFVQAKSPAALLGLAQLHAGGSGPWANPLFRLATHHGLEREDAQYTPEDVVREQVSSVLMQIAVPPK